MDCIILPHSSNAQISVGRFVATWKVWVAAFYPQFNYEDISLPRMNASQCFQESIEMGLESSLDVMCRMLAPQTFLNTMQATNVFMKKNSKWLIPYSAISPAGRKVNGAKLTKESAMIFTGLKPRIRKSLEKDAKQIFKIKSNTQYNITTHHHRFAAWASSTAARSSRLCRFSVKNGVRILDAIGFGPDFSSPKNLPAPIDFDGVHKNWRVAAIAQAQSLGIQNFTHGVAAKLINCYLKSRFVCGPFFSHTKIKALHPPLDRLLLESLERIDFGGQKRQWKSLKLKGWSNFNSGDYEKAIKLMKKTLKKDEFWRIEEFWRGFQ
jgi:hypothetical protein